MLRLDGFASLAASFDGGRVTTRPFALNGSELWVNAKVDYGELTVELLDGEEKPTPRCVAEDGVAIPVRWRTARTAALCAKQRSAPRLQVLVVFGSKINLEIARGL